MFEQDYGGSWQARQVEDFQEEQVAWMSERNGIFFGDDEDVELVEHEDDEPVQYIEHDEPPVFERDEPDDFVLNLRAWLRAA